MNDCRDLKKIIKQVYRAKVPAFLAILVEFPNCLQKT